MNMRNADKRAKQAGRGRRCGVRDEERGHRTIPGFIHFPRFFQLSPAPAAAPQNLLLTATLLLCLFLPVFGQAQASALLSEAGTADAARQSAIAYELTKLPVSAYEPEAPDFLARLLAREELGDAATFVKLAGFMQREDLLDELSEQLRERKDVRRAANLARVRCGNTTKRDNLLKNLREIRVNDEFVYTVVPLLVYTRDRAVLDYLWELTITENKNCHPADADTGSSGRIDCAYRIVEYLGSAIDDFPVAIDDDYNLLTSDYAGALAEIRRWYAANRADYTIDTDTY